MFCEKCGKEIYHYGICGSEICIQTLHHHYDKTTGEEWRSFYNTSATGLFCSKWKHEKIIISNEVISLIRQNVPTRRIKNSKGKYELLALRAHLKNTKLIITTCDKFCCPHCGALDPSQDSNFIVSAANNFYNIFLSIIKKMT